MTDRPTRAWWWCEDTASDAWHWLRHDAAAAPLRVLVYVAFAVFSVGFYLHWRWCPRRRCRGDRAASVRWG